MVVPCSRAGILCSLNTNNSWLPCFHENTQDTASIQHQLSAQCKPLWGAFICIFCHWAPSQEYLSHLILGAKSAMDCWRIAWFFPASKLWSIKIVDAVLHSSIVSPRVLGVLRGQTEDLWRRWPSPRPSLLETLWVTQASLDTLVPLHCKLQWPPGRPPVRSKKVC